MKPMPKMMIDPKTGKSRLRSEVHAGESNGKEEIAVEYGITFQDNAGNYIKLRAERRTFVKDGETSSKAYDRAWEEVLTQVRTLKKAHK